MAIDTPAGPAAREQVVNFPSVRTLSDASALDAPLARDLRSPALVRGLPLLGSALELYRDPMPLFVRGYQQRGPIFRVRVLGREYIVLAGPEATLFLAHGGE